MKILVMSDSHGRSDGMRKAIRREAPLDAIIHLGDLQGGEHLLPGLAKCPVYMVAGNCDYPSDILPREQIIVLGGRRMLLTHGHQYSVSWDTEELLLRAMEEGCTAALFGHTHRPFLSGVEEDVMLLNPGSIAYPRQEDRQRSYMVLETGPDGQFQVALRYL